MGLMDDIAAAEAAKQRGEPAGGRMRRTIGIVMLALGTALVLVGSYASSWHVMDFDVITWEGAKAAKLQIGLWESESCPDRGECTEVSRARVEDFIGELSRSSAADIDAWLDARWQVGVALFLAAAAAAVLLFAVASGQRYKVARILAAATFVVAGAALFLVYRSAFADPVEFMSLGAGTYLALAGTFDLAVGALIFGIAPGDAPLPTAVVVKR